MRFVVVTLGALALAAPAWAATAEISISGTAFSPPATTIDQGDSVRWTNNEAFLTHNVTFPGAPSNTVPPGQTYERPFDSAGTFGYVCTLHPGMSGSVTVYGPTADAQALPLTPEVGEPVSFDGAGSSHNDPAGTIDSYAWAFDDGATDTGGTVSHSYAAAGIYDVVLTVTDGKGATATDTVRVRVGLFARITNVRLKEGNSGTKAAKFVVRLSRASTMATTLDYMTRPGTARSPSDYGARSGTLTFQPGQTTKTIAVPIKGDRRKERTETFTVRLSNPSNAFISDTRGLGTIVNDD